MDLQDVFLKLDRTALERYALSALHRLVVHYGLWFRETIHQMGETEAFRMQEQVWDALWGNHIKRLGKTLDFEVKDDLPTWLGTLDDDRLRSLITALSVNWLANDGIWFQAVENKSSMVEAKLANDTCWGRFSPIEAREIARMLELPADGGLEALKTALAHRLYARLNRMTVEDESDNSIILYVNDCRVQDARKKKGLADYPCKSGGSIEYTYFARTVDARIQTECIACPPDAHPGEWYCAWRFRIE